MIVITVDKSGIIKLPVKVTPNSRQTQFGVVTVDDTAIPIKVAAPPVDGKANEAVCVFLAETLGLPKRSVTVVKGTSSRIKQVHIVLRLEANEMINRLIHLIQAPKGSLVVQ